MPETDCLVGRFATLGRKLVGAWWSGSCVSGIAGILASRLAGASYVGLHRVDASRVEGLWLLLRLARRERCWTATLGCYGARS